jgi:hypothetical protein
VRWKLPFPESSYELSSRCAPVHQLIYWLQHAVPTLVFRPQKDLRGSEGLLFTRAYIDSE